MSGTATRTLEEAIGRAYVYLGRRDRTVAEVRAHLARGQADPELIEQATARLKEQGYLDDERYARCFAEDRRRLDGWGSARIARRLAELGIQRELAQRAAGGQDRESELEAALQVLHRRVRALPRDDRSRRRALDMLLRRGYEPELAAQALGRLEHGADR